MGSHDYKVCGKKITEARTALFLKGVRVFILLRSRLPIVFFRTHYFDLHYLPHHIYNFCAVILFISMDRMPDIHTEDFRTEVRIKP